METVVSTNLTDGLMHSIKTRKAERNVPSVLSALDSEKKNMMVFSFGEFKQLSSKKCADLNLRQEDAIGPKVKYYTYELTSTAKNEFERRAKMPYSSLLEIRKDSLDVLAENKCLKEHKAAFSNQYIQGNNLVDIVKILPESGCLESQKINSADNLIQINHTVAAKSEHPEVFNPNSSVDCVQTKHTTAAESEHPEIWNGNSSVGCVQINHTVAAESEHPEIWNGNSSVGCVQIMHPVETEIGNPENGKTNSLENCIRIVKHPSIVDEYQKTQNDDFSSHYNQDNIPSEELKSFVKNDYKHAQVDGILQDSHCTKTQHDRLEECVSLDHPFESEDSTEDMIYIESCLKYLNEGNEEALSCPTQSLNFELKIAKVLQRALSDLEKNLSTKEYHINLQKLKAEKTLEFSTSFASFIDKDINFDFHKLVNDYDEKLRDIRNDKRECEWYRKNIQEILVTPRIYHKL